MFKIISGFIAFLMLITVNKADILTQSDIVICDKTSSNSIDADCEKKIVLLLQTEAN